MNKRKRVLLILILFSVLCVSCTKGGDSSTVVNAYNYYAAASINNIAYKKPIPIPVATPVPVPLPTGLIPTDSVEEKGITTKKYEEKTDDYSVVAQYPETESVLVNDRVYQIVQNEIDSFLTANGRTGIFDMRYKAYRHNDFMLGFVFDTYEINDTDGYVRSKKSVMFDLIGGNTLLLSDILQGDNYLGVITEYTKNTLEQEVNFEYPFDAMIESALTATGKNQFYRYAFDEEKFYLFVSPNENQFVDVEIPIAAFGDDFNADEYISSYFEKDEEILYEGLENTEIIENTDVSQEQKKYLAITFDDGPDKTHTPFLLDELKKNGSKATFFVLGHKLDALSDIVKRIVDEGHAIGNHSYNHKQLSKLSKGQIEEQYYLTDDLIRQITNQETKLFRPPYGEQTKNIIQTAKEKDMAIITWNIDPRDWEIKDAEAIRKHIVDRAKDGDVILLHDIYKWSVEGAVMAINDLIEQGFTFVTVPELIELYGYEIIAGEVYRNGFGAVKK